MVAQTETNPGNLSCKALAYLAFMSDLLERTVSRPTSRPAPDDDDLRQVPTYSQGPIFSAPEAEPRLYLEHFLFIAALLASFMIGISAWLSIER